MALVTAAVVVFALLVFACWCATSATTTSASTTSRATPPSPCRPTSPPRTSSPGSLLSPATAANVAQTLWPQRLQALTDGDTAVVAAMEAGAARELGPRLPRHLLHVNATRNQLSPGGQQPALVAPPQSAYPLFFVAQQHDTCVCVDENGQNTSRAGDQPGPVHPAGADEPWMVALVTQLDGWVTPLGEPGHVSFDQPLPTVPIDLRTLPTELAQVLQTWRTTGTPPALSSIKTDTGPLVDAGTQFAQIRRDDAARRVIDVATYRSGADEDGFFTAVLGTDDVLGVRVGALGRHPRPAPGTQLVQPDDQSAFTPMLAAGTYNHVSESGVRQTCFQLTISSGSVQLLGDEGGLTSVLPS